MSRPPESWHGDLLGNATEPLLIMVGLLVLGCILSGHWWPLGYAVAGVFFFSVATLYALYLEFNTRVTLDRRERQRQNQPKGWETRSTTSDPGPRRR